MKNVLNAIGIASVLLSACAPQAEKPHVIRTELSASELQAQEEAAEIYGQTADLINSAEFSAPADIPTEEHMLEANSHAAANTVHYQANGQNITAVYNHQGSVPMVQLEGQNLHVMLPQTEVDKNGVVYSNGKHTWRANAQQADWTYNQQTLILTARP